MFYGCTIPSSRTTCPAFPRPTIIAHTRLGDSTTAYDGHAGWIAGGDKPVPVLAVPAAQDLDGIKLDADLAIPGRIKQALDGWLVGFPETTIDDHNVQVVRGITASGSRVKLFFDKLCRRRSTTRTIRRWREFRCRFIGR
jgi:hypothetical protein